jgi:hypothetical protein
MQIKKIKNVLIKIPQTNLYDIQTTKHTSNL